MISLAPAKVNLVLEVLGRFNDGYHEIRSLVQSINLCDVLSFEPGDGISLKCTEPSLQSPDNLVIRAAELLREVSGCSKGAKIEIEKRIPWGAGLGGGSSDAATSLLALNRLWELEMETPDLLKLAARLGSDVAFFIHGGMALIEGRGEKVSPLSVPLPQWFVLMVPPLPRMSHKTQQLYACLGEHHFTRGQFVDKALETWSHNRRISPHLLFNIFEEIAFDAFPSLKDYWRHFGEAGAIDIHLAGSGPTLFAPVDSESCADKLCHCLCQRGFEAYSISTVIDQVV